MSIQMALDAVSEKLRAIRGLEGLKKLETAELDEAIAREKQVEETARREGIMKVVNEGFWETARREFQYALVLRPGSEIVPRTNELLELRDETGRRIGEWVGEKTVRGREGTTQVVLGDFVLYEGVRLKGEPYFVVPEIEFPFLRGVKGIQNVTSCSPAAPVDDLIRGWMGLQGQGLFTRMVGFDIDRDDLD